MVSFTSRPSYTSEKSPWYPVNRWLGVSQILPGHCKGNSYFSNFEKVESIDIVYCTLSRKILSDTGRHMWPFCITQCVCKKVRSLSHDVQGSFTVILFCVNQGTRRICCVSFYR